MRIVDALIEVLKETPGLTHREAYKAIVDKNLYSFGAKDPESVVNGNLRRHCEDLNFPSASPVKYFRIVGQKGNHNTYGLIEDKKQYGNNKARKGKSTIETELLPEEKIDLTYLFYKSKLKKQILDHILDCHPSFFNNW